jgi:hypothetical protein
MLVTILCLLMQPSNSSDKQTVLGTSHLYQPRTLRGCDERHCCRAGACQSFAQACNANAVVNAHLIDRLMFTFRREWPYDKPAAVTKRRKPKGHKHDREKPLRCVLQPAVNSHARFDILHIARLVLHVIFAEMQGG